MKVDLVFEGGGVLGITFIGAYKALKEKGYEIVRCAGTSAGSIISALIIAGYTSDELTDILSKTDYKIFLCKTKTSKILVLGKILSLIMNNGIYNSNVIGNWVGGLLKKKGIETFGDLKENGSGRLKVVASDITRRKMLILPDDLTYYDIDPDKYPVAKAIEMSCSIPFFFTPVILPCGRLAHYIVDGGLLSSYPIWIFDLDGKPVRPTIGLKIKDECSLTSLGKKHIIAFTRDIIDAPINKDEMSFVRDKDLVRTIIIENNGRLKSTDFRLSEKDEEYLFNCGYKSVINFFDEFSFMEYVKTFLI